jgi:hypothetical protein
MAESTNSLDEQWRDGLPEGDGNIHPARRVYQHSIRVQPVPIHIEKKKT